MSRMLRTNQDVSGSVKVATSRLIHTTRSGDISFNATRPQSPLAHSLYLAPLRVFGRRENVNKASHGQKRNRHATIKAVGQSLRRGHRTSEGEFLSLSQSRRLVGASRLASREILGPQVGSASLGFGSSGPAEVFSVSTLSCEPLLLMPPTCALRLPRS